MKPVETKATDKRGTKINFIVTGTGGDKGIFFTHDEATQQGLGGFQRYVGEATVNPAFFT